MRFGTDGKGQTYVEWNRAAPGSNGWARAWICVRSGPKDWAGTGRYLLATRIDAPGGGPAGTGADFPIYRDAPDVDLLRDFAESVAKLTGAPTP